MRLEKAKSQCTTPLRPPDQMAVYFAFLELGDTVLGMDLACGGHLTHGSPVSFSGKFYSFVHYGAKAGRPTSARSAIKWKSFVMRFPFIPLNALEK